MVRSRLNIEPVDPRVVGVDPGGVDVRNRFDIVRVPFSEAIEDPAVAVDRVLASVTTR